MQNLLEDLKSLLSEDERLMVDGELMKNKVVELALQLDKGLIKALLSHESTKKHFFQQVDGVLVFDKIKFQRFVSNKAFLPDSYTAFKNKIGLVNDAGEYLSESKEVVLVWPYKDCVLEGGQTKEEQKRDEIFWNETLAPDEIDRLLDPKVFTNFKRIDKKGEHKLGHFNRDENANIKDNLIIKGNNLLALASLKKQFSGKVKLIYIDPPYNTGNDSFGYNDDFSHSSWLVFMKNRLDVAKEFLRRDGVIFVQCDDNEQAYLKVLMDEVFGPENFVNTIAVKMSEATGVKMSHANIRFPKLKEYLLFYKKKHFPGFVEIDKYQQPVWDKENNIFLDNFSREQRNDLLQLEEKESNTEEDVVKAIEILKGVKKISLNEKIKNSGITDSDKIQEWKFENCYRIIKTAGSSSLAKIVKAKPEIPKQDVAAEISMDGVLFFYFTDFNKDAKDPRFRVIFADSNIYKNPCDFWQDIKTSGAIANEGGVKLDKGKKPEKLLHRIITMITKPNDIVLDYHLGTGTTVAVAHKMNRKYIGIEQLEYGKNDSVVRLKNAINGDKTGISKSVNWQGGGSFIYCELAKANQHFVDKIMKANSAKELKAIRETMQEKAFISYKVDIKAINQNADSFEELGLEDQKKFLIEVLDKNLLYVNYSEIDDKDYKISKEDKALNAQFYSLK